jgi:hypothetical protein
MKRPKQLPAVDRNGARRACAPLGTHVRPSDLWRDIASQFSPQQWWAEHGGIVARPL